MTTAIGRDAHPDSPVVPTTPSPGSRAESPAERRSTAVDGVEVVGALSPSRAADFLGCPLLYRFRTVDRLPEPRSADAARGTLVHKVLEELFDLPALERTPDRARSMLRPLWERLVDDEPDLAELFSAADADPGPALGTAPDAVFERWIAECSRVLERYFTMEDPTRLEPHAREEYVETLLESRLLLRGFVDRIDVAPDGAIRVVDYKTGRSPGVGFESHALFQMKFYALVLWRTRGVVPAVLQLVYLGDGQVVRYEPDEQDLRGVERKLDALWRAISQAHESGDWQPSPGRMCRWCAHQALCPSFGGTPPPLPTA